MITQTIIWPIVIAASAGTLAWSVVRAKPVQLVAAACVLVAAVWAVA